MSALEGRVTAAADAAMAGSRSVSALDVLGGLGWLTQNHIGYWRQGRSPHLDPLLQMRTANLRTALEVLQRWAAERGLVPHEVAHVSSTRDRRARRRHADPAGQEGHRPGRRRGALGPRGSGRVGRSAAGRALAEEPVVRAVVASVRHEDTDYDELLMAGVPRDEARERIRDDVARVLDGWRSTV
jgi:hypothetical protein